MSYRAVANSTDEKFLLATIRVDLQQPYVAITLMNLIRYSAVFVRRSMQYALLIYKWPDTESTDDEDSIEQG